MKKAKKRCKMFFLFALSLLIATTSIISLDLPLVLASSNQYASVSFTTPGDGSSSSIYSAHVYFAQMATWGGYGTVSESQTCDVTYEYADGTSSVVSTVFNYTYDNDLWLSKLYADLTSIPSGCTVTISNIQVVRDEETDSWKNYTSTDGAVILTSSNSNEVITALFDGLQPIQANEINVFEFESEGADEGEDSGSGSTTHASVSIVIPDAGAQDETYSMHIQFVRYSQWGSFVSATSAETYYVTYTYTDGTSETILETFNIQYDEEYEHSEIYLDIDNIEAGTIITVNDVQVVRDESDTWNNYIQTYTAVELTSTDETQTISLIGDTERLLEAGTTQVYEFSVEFSEEQTDLRYTDLSIIVPDDGTQGIAYDVNVYISRYTELGDFVAINESETYEITYTYTDGSSETISTSFSYQYDDVDEHSELYVTLENIAAGTVITISDMQIFKEESDTWNNYVQTYAAVELTSTDETQIISVIGDTERLLVANTTQVYEFSIEYIEEQADLRYTDLSIIVPDDGVEGKIYDVNIYISRYSELGDFVTINASEIYEITYTYTDGSSETKATSFYGKYDDVDEHSELYLELENIAAGTVITISNMQIFREESDTWNNYVSAIAEVIIFSNENTELFSCLTDNPTTLQANTTAVFEFESYEADVKRETDDTFTSLGGEYTLEYLLSNYNAVSFEDIEGTHIVGPIIAQAGAYRTDEEAFDGDDSTVDQSSALVASDYSKGISSYVGTLSSIAGDSTTSSLLLGYGYDTLYYADFQAPYFYTRSTELTDSSYDIFVQERFVHNDLLDYVILEIDGSEFISPNDHGQTLTYQTDNFMDFDYLQELMIQASYDLVQDGRIDEEVEVNVVTEAITTLTITAGESWTIVDASNLTTVNILLPDDYDYYTNSALEATTINIIDDTINPTYIDGVLHSQFPIVLVDGEQITVFAGENGEYGEVGNKIIWNLPNIVTDSETGYNRLVFFGSGSNIAGHILAPQAEVWNYKEYSDGVQWEGGNINGTIIAAAIHIGNMEMHMWPYDGAAEGGIFTAIEVEKTFTNGDIESTSFSFELSQIDGENYDGLLNIGFPLTASTDETGIATFQTIVFNEEGTYKFALTEVIPTDTGNIDYDLSEYLVEIEVTRQDDGFFVTQMIYKLTVDAFGNTLEELVEVDKVTYENIVIADLPVTYSLTKTNQYSQMISGAVFEVYEIDDTYSFDSFDENYEDFIDEDGYYAQVSSNNSGVIYIEDLEKGEDYILVETQAPEDHIISDGYWILSVSETGRVTTMAMEGAEDIEDNEVYNERIEQKQTEVTLYKVNQYGALIAGAEFEVYRIVSLQDHRQVDGDYYQTYEVDTNTGDFTITGLETGYVYMLVETQAPVGYIQETGSWIISVTANDDGLADIEFISVDGAPEIVDNNIINYAQSFELPEVGGVGTAMYYTVAVVLICYGLILLTRRASKNKKRKTF